MKIILKNIINEAEYTNINTVLPEYEIDEPVVSKGKTSKRKLEFSSGITDKEYITIRKFFNNPKYIEELLTRLLFYTKFSELSDFFMKKGYIIQSSNIISVKEFINGDAFKNLQLYPGVLKNNKLAIYPYNFINHDFFDFIIDDNFVAKTKYGYLYSTDRYNNLYLYPNGHEDEQKFDHLLSKLVGPNHRSNNVNTVQVLKIEIKNKIDIDKIILSKDDKKYLFEFIKNIIDKNKDDKMFDDFRDFMPSKRFSNLQYDEQIPKELKDKIEQSKQNIAKAKSKHNISPPVTLSKRFKKLDMNESKINKIKIINIINEGKIEDLVKKYPKLNSLYSDGKLSDLKPAYVKWIAEQSEPPEDVIDLIYQFEKNIQRLKEKNIFKYNSNSLRDELEKIGKSINDIKKKRQLKLDNLEIGLL